MGRARVFEGVACRLNGDWLYLLRLMYSGRNRILGKHSSRFGVSAQPKVAEYLPVRGDGKWNGGTLEYMEWCDRAKSLFAIWNGVRAIADISKQAAPSSIVAVVLAGSSAPTRALPAL
jgi:hypothetical protein